MKFKLFTLLSLIFLISVGAKGCGNDEIPHEFQPLPAPQETPYHPAPVAPPSQQPRS